MVGALCLDLRVIPAPIAATLGSTLGLVTLVAGEVAARTLDLEAVTDIPAVCQHSPQLVIDLVLAQAETHN